MTRFRLRYVVPTLLASLFVIAISAFAAVSLFSEQSSISTVLNENEKSQRSAVKLEVCLRDLIAAEEAGTRKVTAMHERVRELLNSVRESADQPEEKRLYDSMEKGFQKYLTLWPLGDSPDRDEARAQATATLKNEVLKPCQEFEHFNTHRVEQSAEQHERILKRIAWGMGGIGLLGGLAGVALGFGVARGLAKSIQRLQIQLRDAAGKLGPDLPEIVFTGDGDFGQLHLEIERLSERIEQVVRDLHQRETEVLRAEQLAAVGQLAAGVAHEIRNPLTSIKMLIQTVEGDGGKMTSEDLRVIEAEIRRMERLLNTFLDFARPPKLRRKSIVLSALFEDVFGLLRVRADKQHVTLRTAGNTNVSVTADPDQLRQVLMNLCLNALDAMPSGGTLEASIRLHGEAVEIEIADTGPGIAKAMFPRLFQPFASSKDTGLGLGLVISKRIIEDHGGSVTAANRPGGGASFFIRLPAEVPDADSTPRR